MSINPGSVQLASVGILRERQREQESKRNREEVYAIYVNATPTPADAHPAVHIVEAVMKEHCVATAIFYANEEARFKAALAKVEALSK